MKSEEQKIKVIDNSLNSENISELWLTVGNFSNFKCSLKIILVRDFQYFKIIFNINLYTISKS